MKEMSKSQKENCPFLVIWRTLEAKGGLQENLYSVHSLFIEPLFAICNERYKKVSFIDLKI